MSSPRKNYLKASAKTGVYNYRRGIPSKYRRFFVKPDGSLRGAEWKETLKTRNKSTALALAAAINIRFEQTLFIARIEEHKTQGTTKRQWEKTFISAIKLYGIHPEQAPSILAPSEDQKQWKRRLLEYIELLKEIQTEYIEVSGDFAEEIYKPTKDYHLIQEQINYLMGRGSSIIKTGLRPTLRSTMEEYITQKISSSVETADPEARQKINRVNRVCNSFASFIGNGSIENGLDTYLADLERSQSRDWMHYLIHDQKKAGSSVGRELTILSSIYNLAVTEHGKDNPELRSDYNPFSKLRTDAEAFHSEQLRLGKRIKLNSRVWKPKEIQAFIERLNLMNPQLRIIAQLSMLTGARLKDNSGLMLADIYLNNDDDSYVWYRHNQNRKVSKDSIERRVPLFGSILNDLLGYTSGLDPKEQSLFPRYCGSRQSDNVSAALNKKHLDLIDEDPTFKMHGLRDTLSAKFMATNVPNDIAGYLIGWRNKTTIGMQTKYQRGGYPHDIMLNALKKAYAITNWGTDH